ncbi:MAG TPA: glycosyltransferase family 4 protein [Halanaerobiales bacterium]|nr:glycosyltransferase family 4 protein [Halanaerobiales bacterium]
MKIAMIHFRTKQTDGVSLEMDKWRDVLEDLGHQVIYITGSKDEKEVYLPELEYRNERNLKLVEEIFKKENPSKTEEQIKEDIYNYANQFKTKFKKIIKKRDIDLLIPNNVFSLGWNIAVGFGLAQAIEELELAAIAHHHDFYWERELYQDPNYKIVELMLEKYFPPKLASIRHVVINRIAQKKLMNKKDIWSEVVPNVFDFKQDHWKINEDNKDLKRELGLKENDIIFLQATRIAERKAIELAINFVSKFKRQYKEKLINNNLYDNRQFRKENEIVLVMPGLEEDNESYISKLKKLANEKGVRIIWAHQLLKENRYSLWDFYANCDMITYPSIKEGWGNQLLEGFFSKKPIMIYEYPVFKTDIQKYNPIVASLGSGYESKTNGLVSIEEKRYKEPLEEAYKYLTNNEYRQEAVNYNFVIARRNFSKERLKEILEKLLSNFI